MQIQMSHFLLAVLCLPAIASAQNTETSKSIAVTFLLEAPGLADNTPVFITGSLPALGNWNPAAMQMKSLGDHKWSIQIITERGYPIEYKYTLGSWKKEAASEDGQPLQNFAIRPETKVTIKDRILQWTDGKNKQVVGQITGNVKYHRQLQVDGLLPRDVVVWLPHDYEKSESRYPVLYMHDGQNIFDPQTSSFGVDWQVDETLTELIAKNKVIPIIVVGIYHTPQRGRDYLPGEQGTQYEHFICDNLKPLIDKTYRTDPSREATAIGGSSAGGICAFAIAWQRPEVFSKAICMSPAFQYKRADGSMTVDYVTQFKQSQRPANPPFFYLDNGGVGLEEILQPGIDAMLAAMKDKGMEPDADFTWKKYPESRHNEAAWAKRLPAALQLLFGT